MSVYVCIYMGVYVYIYKTIYMHILYILHIYVLTQEDIMFFLKLSNLKKIIKPK